MLWVLCPLLPIWSKTTLHYFNNYCWNFLLSFSNQRNWWSRKKNKISCIPSLWTVCAYPFGSWAVSWIGLYGLKIYSLPLMHGHLLFCCHLLLCKSHPWSLVPKEVWFLVQQSPMPPCLCLICCLLWVSDVLSNGFVSKFNLWIILCLICVCIIFLSKVCSLWESCFCCVRCEKDFKIYCVHYEKSLRSLWWVRYEKFAVFVVHGTRGKTQT